MIFFFYCTGRDYLLFVEIMSLLKRYGNKCHDANSEIYYVTFSRDTVRITSYQNDSIRTTVETWADSVPALA